MYARREKSLTGRLYMMFILIMFTAVMGGFAICAVKADNAIDSREETYREVADKSERAIRYAEFVILFVGCLTGVCAATITAIGVFVSIQAHRQSKRAKDLIGQAEEAMDRATGYEKEAKKWRDKYKAAADLAIVEPVKRFEKEEEEAEEIGKVERERRERLGARLEVAEGLAQEEPDNVYAYLSIAQVQETLGNNEKAIAAYGRAIGLAPRNWRNYRYKAELLVKQNKHNEALECAKEGIKNIPDNQRLTNLAGRILSGMKEWQESRRYYEKSGEILEKKISSGDSSESDLLNYYENLLILEKYEEAEEWRSKIKGSVQKRKYLLLIEFFSVCLHFLDKRDENDGFEAIHKLLKEIENAPIRSGDKSTWNFGDLNPYLQRLRENIYKSCLAAEEVLKAEIHVDEAEKIIRDLESADTRA